MKPKIDKRGLVLTEDISWSEERKCGREKTPIPESF